MNRHFELSFIAEGGTPQSINVELGDGAPAFIIGSGAAAGLRLQAPGIAADHCKLLLSSAGEVELIHLAASGTATLRNGERIETAVLNNGDRIAIGTTELIVWFGRTGSDDAPAAAHATLRGSRGSSALRGGSSGLQRGSRGGDFNLSNPINPLVERAIAELEREYPERAALRSAEERRSLLERGCAQAKNYGFDKPDLAMRFLHCVFLLDNDLSKPTNSDVAYVIDTLTVPNKPAERRLDRAVTIARRAAPPPASAPIPAATPVAPVAASPSRRKIQSPSSAPAMKETVGDADSMPEPSKGPTISGADLPPVTTVRESADVKRSSPPVTRPSRPRKRNSELPEIEGFRIIEAIASGGMGTVYRAHDVQLDIEVAIKVLRSMHPSAQAQFLLEARAAARLQHPHIVPVLRYEQYGQGGYCVMQLIKGKDAHRLVRRFAETTAHEKESHDILEIADLDPASITPDLRALLRVKQPYYRFVAYWLTGVAEGLDRAHAEGIVHYDVKPSNMMVAADGRMMLGDFGLATLADRQLASSNSTCIGTPGYLSPEMLAGWASRTGSADTDSRVDIWGLGLTLYEFLTYKPAYDGALSKVLRSIATTEPMRPSDVVWQTPAELERICRKAMARNPDDRYRRASEMADDLRNFLSGEVGRASRPAPGPLAWLKRPQQNK